MIKVGVAKRLFLTAGIISATGKSKRLGSNSGMEDKNTIQNLDSRILLIQKKNPQENIPWALSIK
jgi:hypothetical protein